MFKKFLAFGLFLFAIATAHAQVCLICPPDDGLIEDPIDGGGGGGTTPSVSFTGTSSVDLNGTYTYTVSVSGGTHSGTSYSISGGQILSHSRNYVTVKWTSVGSKWVRATATVSGNFYTKTKYVTVISSIPTATQESGRTNTSFYANWNTVSGATTYYLDVANNSSFTSFVSGYNGKLVGDTNGDGGLDEVIEGGNGDSYIPGTAQVTGLQPGKNYYYRVRSRKSNGSVSGNSNTITANTSINAPGKVEESENATTSFRARWGSISGASYRIDVSTTSNFSSILSGYNNKSVSGTSHVVTGLTPGKYYYYRVRAQGPHYTSGNNATVTAHTTISAPSKIEESNRTTTSFTARWGSVTGAQSYRLDVSDRSDFATKLTNYNNLNVGNNTSRSVTGLTPGKNYYYRVRAVGTNRTSGNSSRVTANTSISAPSKIEESNRATTSFTARWGSVSGAQSYRLDVSDKSDFSTKLSSYNNLNVGNVTSRSVTGLTPGKNYYYRVRAVGQHHTSGSSSRVTANTSISAPSKIEESSRATTSFTARWGSVTGAQSYRLDVSDKSDFSSKLSGFDNLNVGTATSKSVTGLTPGKNYYYRVRAVGLHYTSGNSSRVTANTSISAPSKIEESSRATTSFTARWGSVSGAQSYRLDVSDKSDFSTRLLGYDNLNMGTATSKSVTGLTPGKNYYYRVRAVGIHHTSGNSSRVTANTSISAPSKIEETSRATTSFTARWGDVAGAQSYRLDVSEVSNFSTKLTNYNNLNVGIATSRSVTGLTPGKNYYYRVRAVGTHHTSGSSSVVTANTSIAAPAKLEESSRTTTSFTANWGLVVGAQSFRLDVSDKSDFSTKLSGYDNLNVGSASSKSITGLTPGKNYYYRVRAVGANHTSGNSSKVTANTSIAAPSKIEETSRTTTSFTARWGSVTGSQSYRLDVSERTDFATKLSGYDNLNVGTATTKAVTGLTPGKNYYYRVRAVGQHHTSGSSSRVTANTSISAPSKIEESSRAATSFTARWGSVTGAQSYRLDVSDKSDFSTKVVGFDNLNVGNVTSKSVTGLTPGKNYYYRVRAVGANHTSGNSSQVTANTSIAAPSKIEESNRATTSFTARWGSVPGAQSYRLDVSAVSNFSTKLTGYNNLNVGNATSRSITGLTPGVKYYYRVRAVGANHTSGNSSQVTAHTSIVAPVAKEESGKSTSQFVAHWDPVTHATSYRLDVSTTSSFSSFVSGYNSKNVGSTTSHTLTGLTPGEKYYYRVRSVSSDAISSSNSSVITANTTLSAPTGLDESNQSKFSFTANWTGTSGASTYRIQVSTTSNYSSVVEDQTISGTSLNVIGLLYGTTYYFRVRAISADNIQSNYAYATVYPLVLPGSISYSEEVCHGNTPGQISGTLPSGGTGSYEYQWQYWTGSAWSTLVQGSQYRHYTPTMNITSDTQFRRRVRSGDSGWKSTTNLVVKVYDIISAIGSLSATSDKLCSGTLTEFTYTPSAGVNTNNARLIGERESRKVDFGVIHSTKSINVKEGYTYYVEYTQQCTSTKYKTASTNLNFYAGCNVPPSLDQNFVRTEVPRVPVTNEYELAVLDANDKSTTYSYSDGLGRKTMNVAVEAGQNYEDIIQFNKYNTEGRQDKTYMSYYKESMNPGEFIDVTQAVIEQKNFYENEPNIGNGTKAFSKTEWDARGKVKSVIAPGEVWHNNNKKTEYDYQVYDPSVHGKIAHWVIENGKPRNDRHYLAKELGVSIVTDAENRKTRTIKDSKGLSITSQVYDIDSGWIGSYNVYDDFGRIRFVVPPKLNGYALDETNYSQAVTEQQVSELLFEYQYDRKGRVIRERAPGAGWIEYVFDRWNRLVLKRHAAQVQNCDNEGANCDIYWTFYKYDALNRQIMSGEVQISSSRDVLQNLLDNSSDGRFETVNLDSKNGYTKYKTFPKLNSSNYSSYEIQTINYFDNYDFLTATNWDEEANHNFNLDVPEGFETFGWAPEGYELVTEDRELQDKRLVAPGGVPPTGNYVHNGKFAVRGNAEITFAQNVVPGPDFEVIQAEEPYQNVVGKSTGSKVRILGSGVWLSSVIYYDERGRIVQTVAENHIGGIDRLSNEQKWDGEIRRTLLEHDSYLEGVFNEGLNVLNEYEYAHNGQLLKTYQTISDVDQNGAVTPGEKVLVGDYHYNVLGEIIERNLHSVNDGVSYLQSVDYQYNLQGAMTGINNTKLDDGESDLFGMEYFYERGLNINDQTTDARYDGMLSAITWNATNITPGVDPITGPKGNQRTAFGFTYDERNRLSSTAYATSSLDGSFNQQANHFSMQASYDDNGNIQTLTRNSNGAQIDNLDYKYKDYSNKLKGVDDLSTTVTRDVGMNDKVTSSGADIEFSYDAMGNATSDLNKEIVKIQYNQFQLVETITFGDGSQLEYSYDAARNRLAKSIIDSDNNVIAKVDYIGLIEYLDDEVNQIFTDEGRAYKQNDTYHYEYFITDHQGNNRVSFGDLPERNIYTATMESDHSAREESEFAFPSGIRTTSENHTPLGTESIYLNGTVANRRIGPAKVLSISANDRVDMEVWAKYTFNNWDNTSITDIATSVMSTFNGLGYGTDAEGVSTSLSNVLGNQGAAGLFTNADADQPRAYLQYLFFDENYAFVEGNSGFLSVGESADGQFTKLATQELIFNSPGFLFVYLVNESAQDAEVYFDDLKITHSSATSNFKVSQINDFYPFGLPTSKSWRSSGYIDPGLLYQSSYASYDSLTGYYNFLSRSYDPTIGRFFAVDPAGQFSSPYAGMGNIPHFGTDPNGEIFFLGLTGLAAVLAKGAVIGAGVGAVSYTAQKAITGQKWNIGEFGKAIGMGAVSGAVAGGVGHAFGGVGKFGHELGRAFVHGHTQTMVGAAFGQDPTLGGFAAGMAGSLLGSGLNKASVGVQIGGSALLGGAISELTNEGSFWQGFMTSAITASANHAMHRGIQKTQDKYLINRYKKGEKFDLSRVSKMRLNIERGARLAFLHTRGHEDLKGPMRMGDIFDFKSMTKPYSGWKNLTGLGVNMWIHKSIPGLDRIVFQESVANIIDMDMTNDGRMEFVTSSHGSPPGIVDYNMSTVANQSNFYLARYFMYYGTYEW